MKYLPFGYIPQTSEELAKQDKKFKQYDYYGIPYDKLDDTSRETASIEVEEDRNKASLLIMQGIELPDDLKQRLLKYKLEEKESKKIIKKV